MINKFVIIGGLQCPLTSSKIRCRGIANYIARKKIQVTYLEPGLIQNEEKIDLKNVNYIRTNYPSFKMNAGFFLAIINNIKEIIKISDIDYILSAKSLPTSCIPALLKKSKKTKIILDIDDLEYAYWSNNKIISKLLMVFERMVAKHFDFITVHNDALKEYAVKELKFPAERIISLPQGLDVDLYSFRRVPADFILEDKKVLIYAAFLGVASELMEIFEVYRDIKKEFPEVILIIIGDGPRLEEFKNYSSENQLGIIFTGYKEHKESLDIIQRADVAINYLEDNLANKYRSSIKIREYLALGKKVVANNVGDTYLFEKYLYLSDNNKESFKSKIINALKNKKNNKDGKNYVYKNYCWSKIIDKFIKDLDKNNEKNTFNKSAKS